MKMKIDLNNEQFETIIRALGTSGYLYGVLGEAIGEAYGEKHQDVEDLLNYLLRFSKDFQFNRENIEMEEGGNYLSEGYISEIDDEISDYEESTFGEGLARKLAERDIEKKYGGSKNGQDEDKITDELFEKIDQYIQEFEKNGLDNVKIGK